MSATARTWDPAMPGNGYWENVAREAGRRPKPRPASAVVVLHEVPQKVRRGTCFICDTIFIVQSRFGAIPRVCPTHNTPHYRAVVARKHGRRPYHRKGPYHPKGQS